MSFATASTNTTQREHAEDLFAAIRDRCSDSSLSIPDEIDRYTEQVQWMMTFRRDKFDAVRKMLMAMTTRPRVVVELGGYVGKSALDFGLLLREMHMLGSHDAQCLQQEPEVKVLVIERMSRFVEIIKSFADLARLEQIIKAVDGDSVEVLQRLKEEHGIECIDVLFLDHWQEYYVRDLELCEDLGLLRVGSLVVADNTDFPGAPEYLSYFKDASDRGYRYDCVTVVVDGPEGAAVRKPSRVT